MLHPELKAVRDMIEWHEGKLEEFLVRERVLIAKAWRETGDPTLLMDVETIAMATGKSTSTVRKWMCRPENKSLLSKTHSGLRAVRSGDLKKLMQRRIGVPQGD